jgi:hypothetical protein
MANRMFRDPPMHEDCARFAAEHCSFLNGTLTEMRDKPSDQTPPQGQVFVVDTKMNPKLDEVLMYITRAYATKSTPQGILIRAAPAKQVISLRS